MLHAPASPHSGWYMVARYESERELVSPHSHAWFPYATTSNYARRRCAIGPRRIAVFIGHACCFYRFDSFRANYNIYNTTSMKTAVRLGPIAHLRRAKCIGNISNNQAWEWGEDKPPLTLIPGYLISPLTGWGWRMKFPNKTIQSHAEHFYGFWTPYKMNNEQWIMNSA